MSSRKPALLLASLLGLSSALMATTPATETTPPPTTTPMTAAVPVSPPMPTAIPNANPPSPAIPTAITQQLNQLLPGITPDHIEETPLAGLYEVMIGSEVVYLSANGRFLIKGELLDLQQKQNLTENRLNQLHSKTLAQVKEEDMIVFAPDDYQHTITVFTDIDCGYCRKLHNEMAGFAAQKIRVRYLLYPRTGLDSPSYDKAVSVWCAQDRKQALTQAKQDKPIAAKTCENPVSQQMELGHSLGVSGTPTIILESGKVIPGYLPPIRLAALLNDKSP